MSKPLQRFRRRSRLFCEIATLCHRTNPRWYPGYIFALGRALRLCKKERFEPAEAFRLGLFRWAQCNHGPSPYISRKRLTKAQETLNPTSWASLLKNKDLFYRYCTALGIPIPQLYAVIQSSSPGWSYTGRAIRARDD